MMIMLKLYQSLWGEGTKADGLRVIFKGQCEVPHLGLEDHTVGEDVGMELDSSRYSFEYIQLPDGVAFPTVGNPQQSPRTNLLIRPCYEEILKRLFGFGNSAAVLGGPGIGECIEPNSHIFQLTRGTGKTLLLSYILVKKLLAAEPVSYQSTPRIFFCFNADGAFAYIDDKNPPIDRSRWHLVDSSYHLTMPEIYYGFGHIIQATSPRNLICNDWVQDLSGREFWMEPFSWQEMYVTA
jgi:hypothetical protein